MLVGNDVCVRVVFVNSETNNSQFVIASLCQSYTFIPFVCTGT